MTIWRLPDSKRCGQLYLTCILLIFTAGCRLDLSGVDQAEQELLAIPEIEAPATRLLPTSTPIPNYTPADALEIATAVAENRALITPSPIPTIQPIEDRDYLFPLLVNGENYREVPGGVWYTTESSAAEVKEFYLDDMIYYRWNYEIGEEGEGYADIQFWNFDDRLQLTVWENPERGVTIISMMDVDELVDALGELPASLYEGRWPVIGDQLGLLPDGGAVYTIDLPLSIVRSFYLTNLLDAGWLPVLVDRQTPSTLQLDFVRGDEELSFLLQDEENGTTVSWPGG